MIATPAQASSRDMRLFVALFPDFCQVEGEAGKLRIARYRSRIIETNDRIIGAINEDLPLWPVNNEPELCAVRDVLTELELQLLERVAWRPQLNYKVGTYRRKNLLFFRFQRIPALAQNPGGIRRTL